MHDLIELTCDEIELVGGGQPIAVNINVGVQNNIAPVTQVAIAANILSGGAIAAISQSVKLPQFNNMVF